MYPTTLLLVLLSVAEAFLTRGARSTTHRDLLSMSAETGLSLSGVMGIAAASDRGQTATLAEQSSVEQFARSVAGDAGGKTLDGEWRLVWASEAPYRSSPFFWGFRKLCDGVTSPVLDDSFAEAVFKITDGIPFKNIAGAKQTISGSRFVGGTLKSEVVMQISVFDALLPKAQSVMTTTATTAPLEGSASAADVELTLQTTEVKDSSIASVPGFAFVDDLKFPTEEVFNAVEQLRGASSGATAVIEMRNTLFEAGDMRVCFTPDEKNFFLWARSAEASPGDESSDVAVAGEGGEEKGQPMMEEEEGIDESDFPSDVEL
jgi:hypothetical protein